MLFSRAAVRSILCLTVAYGLTGLLALYPAIPPGYTAPFFPAAGVALLSLLLWGCELWPGVFLGSMLVQLVACWQSGAYGVGWSSVLLVPLAASAQAWLGVGLIRAWVGWPNRLDHARDVLRLMLCAIPVSCLLSSLLSVGVLTLLGVIAWQDALFNAWSWWLGDTFGCIVVLPLMLAWFGRERGEWRARAWMISVPILICIVLIAVMSSLIHRWESQRIQGQFNRDADQVDQLLRSRLEAQLDVVLSLSQAQALAPADSASSWQRLAQPWLQRFPGTQNLAWSPAVYALSRAAFEHQGLQDHPIMARNAAGGLFVSPSRPMYLPLQLIDPLDNNRQAYGLDILSSPPLARALKQTLLSGQPAASAGLRLVQESGAQRGIVLYQSVRQPVGAARDGRLVGVVSSVFRMDDVLGVVQRRATRHAIDICLADESIPASIERLAGPERCELAAWLARGPHVISRFNFAGRHWVLRLRANASYLAGLRSWLEWTLFVVGWAISGLLGAFLLISTGYTRRVETEVAVRTNQLAQSNEQLQQQLDATQKAEVRVEFLAMHDSLTGLLNRACWLMRAQQLMSEAQSSLQRFAVLFLDLDEFKTVNDSLGHPVGDKLLVQIARRLLLPLPAGSLLGRHGGDEFVVLLPYDDLEQVQTICQDLLATFLRSVVVDQHELHTTASIGVALFPQDGSDPDTLLQHADLAMYAAKGAGRDTMRFYSAQMNANALERLTLEQDLHRALLEDPAQFLLHFQPQIDASSGLCVGCEALVRWQHPVRGLLMPGGFIPLAERSGLIVPLGLWVLTEACRQSVEWAEAGIHLPISVNVSPVQLARSDLPQVVAGLFRAYQVAPGAIELELTESALMDDDDQNLSHFHALLALGCSFALDDFGTGYSSLSRLKRYPISRLKIDQSFVQTLPGDAEDSAIIKATLSLARNLWLQVVAEGVETQEQHDALLAMECHVMQGYWFARPMPPQAFIQFFIAMRQSVAESSDALGTLVSPTAARGLGQAG